MSKRFTTHLAVTGLFIAAVASLSFASGSVTSGLYSYINVISGSEAVDGPVASPVERPRNNPNLLVGLSGTYNVPGDFPDLAAAIASLNSNGVAGPVTLNVTAPQTSPANSGSTGGGFIIGGAGSLLLTTTSGTNTVTIQGNGNTVTAPTNLVVGQLNDAIFKLVGADWVSITGFTMQENAANTVTTAGSNNMTEWGVALLYVTTTDGAQNDTIQNNTITLNRSYANTFGIYANSTHSTTAVTSSVSATGAAGGNSGLKVYGNSISNVNMGVVVIGPVAASDVNTGVDIGGTGGAQANTITNFGTTASFSGYVNVSGTVNGILIRNTNGFNVSHNTITSSAGGTTSGTLNGILIPVPTNAPTGTFTNTINSNAISLFSGAGASGINGISIPNSSGSSTATLNVNGNNFTGFGYVTDGVSAVNFITNSSNYQTQSISNNTFTNNSVNTSGTVIVISNGTSLPTGGSKNVNGNSIVGTFSKPAAGGILTLFSDSGTDAAGTTNNTNNNNFSNITVSGATSFNGILNSNTSANKSVSNNTISNVSAGSNAAQGISVTLDTGTTAVSGNTVSGFSVAGGAVTGVVCGASPGASTLNCSQNTIQGLSSAGGAVVGMSVAGATTLTTRNVFKNKIYNNQTTTSAGSVYGIQVLTGTTVNLYNNLIGDLKAPLGNADDMIRGISANSTTSNSNVNVSYNTVYLNASSTGATFGSTAIFHSANATSTTGTLNLRNNILVNNSTQNGAGIAAVYRRSNTPLNNFGSVSNNNLFYISSPGTSRYFFYNSSAGDTSLTAYKARVTPADSASVTENPVFVSTNGGDATFLHISTAMITQIESGGIPIAGISDDFDGDSRNASTPDIGADEFVGAVSDNTPPGITYTTLSDTSSLLNPTLGVSMTDATGVASGTNLPRIYFKKSTDGAYASSQCAFSSGNAQNGTYLCTINYAQVGGGAVSAGNTIQYFVAAQDTLGNFTTNPIGGTGNVNAVAFGGAPNTYVIRPLISGNKNVGAGGDYPTITAALTALTNADLGGPLTLTLTDASYGSETFPLTINANPGSSATNTITIKPATGVNVSITGNNTGCILNLSGADWVTVDGSNNGTASRNLTLSNTSTNSNSAVVCLNSLGVGQGATNNTIENVNIVGFGTTATPATLFGIYAGAGTIGRTAAGPDNDNNTYQNNNISKTSIGIYSGGESAANKNTGTVIKQNVMNSASPNNLIEGGILVRFDDGSLITENDISVLRNDGTLSASGLTNTAFGIALGLVPSNTVSNFTGSDVTNSSITRNKINGVVQLYNDSTPDGYSAFGIVLNAVTSGTALIANNMISGVRSAATASDFSAGIVAGGGSGSSTQIYFNSVSMTGSRLGGDFPSYALAIGGGDPTVDLRDNIFLNSQTGGSGKNYAIGTASGTFSNLTSDFNDLFTSGANTFVGQTGGLGVAGTDQATFANWKAATGKDASSLNVNPLFNSATDLHLQGTSPVLNLATPIGAVTLDFDGQTRSATTPDIGADEISNQPPVFTGPVQSSFSVTEGHQVAFTVTASDPESDAFTLSMTNPNITGAQPTFDPNTGQFSWTPDLSQAGPYDIEFKATDIFNNVASRMIHIDVADAVPGTIALSSATYSIAENGGSATITVNRTGGSDGAVGVSYSTSNGTATGGASCTGSADYVSASGTLSWADGNAASKTFSVPICDDAVFEGNETVNISISTATGGAAVGSPSSAVLTIVDNDSAQPMATNLSAAETYTEDTSLNLIDIVVSDADSTSVTATLTLSNAAAGSLTTGTSNAVTSTFNAASGVWTASGAIADVNVLLAGVTFVPTANFNSNFTIATSVTDGTTSPVTGSKAMTGTAVNDAPVLDASKTPVLAAELEDSPAPAGAVGTLVSSLVDLAVPSGQLDNVTDVDTGALPGVAVVATDSTNGVWFYTINNGTTWNAVGAVADSNARLLAADVNTRIYFQPNANFNGTVVNAITFRAWDQTSGTNGGLASATSNGGTTAFSVATDTAALTITAVNDAPTATNLSAAETYTEDTPLNLIDIVVADVDSSSVTATLTLSNPAAGSLSTATSNSVTSSYNGVTGVWTATGPIADVNVLLAGVTFNPAANFNSNFSITTNVSDGSLSVSGNKAVTGVAVNDPPTATNLSAAETYTEDTPLNLTDIVVSDIDSPSVTATLTLSNTAAGSLSTGTSGAITSTYNAATGVWSASGAIANVNTLLAGVVFTPAPNFNSNFSIATSVSDGVAAAITGSKAMTGVAVNDPPTATNLSASETYTEDTSLNLIDIVVTDVDSSTITATLSLSNAAAGSLTTATSGSVTSTYNSATGVWTASGAVSDVNVLLAGVTFVPTTNFNANFSISTNVSDGIAVPVTGNKAMTGIAVNDAPVLDASKSPTFVPELQDSPAPTGAVGTLVSSLVDFASPAGQVDNVTDVDAGALLGIAITGANTTNGAWFYSINGGTTWNALGTVSDASSRLLAADANTRIYFQPAAGFNGTVANGITFRAWDQTSGNANGSAAAATPNGGVTAFSSASDTASITINAVSSGTMQFSSAAYAGNEGTSVTVTVNRSTSSGSTSIHYATSDGTATAGTCGSGNADYVAASGDLAFSAGETVKTFVVGLCTDSISETPAETLNLTLTGAVGAQSTATITIYDAATEFVNNTPLNFSGGTAAVSSQITTSAATSVSGVRITLFGVTAPNADNIDILLVAPNGAKYVLMGDVGGVNSLSNQTITIEDVATAFMPDATAITAGVNYRPTTCGGAEHDFGGGAPAGPYSQPGCGPLFTTTLGSVFGNVTPNGTWTLYARDDNGVDPLGATNSISGWGIQLLAPTAAPVSISGRLLTSSGQGIRNANVTIWGGTLPAPVTVKTGTFGYYTFEGLQPGTTYIISVDAKKFVVGNPTRSVTVFDSVAGFDFIAEPRE